LPSFIGFSRSLSLSLSLPPLYSSLLLFVCSLFRIRGDAAAAAAAATAATLDPETFWSRSRTADKLASFIIFRRGINETAAPVVESAGFESPEELGRCLMLISRGSRTIYVSGTRDRSQYARINVHLLRIDGRCSAVPQFRGNSRGIETIYRARYGGQIIEINSDRRRGGGRSFAPGGLLLSRPDIDGEIGKNTV